MAQISLLMWRNDSMPGRGKRRKLLVCSTQPRSQHQAEHLCHTCSGITRSSSHCPSCPELRTWAKYRVVKTKLRLLRGPLWGWHGQIWFIQGTHGRAAIHWTALNVSRYGGHWQMTICPASLGTLASSDQTSANLQQVPLTLKSAARALTQERRSRGSSTSSFGRWAPQWPFYVNQFWSVTKISLKKLRTLRPPMTEATF